MKSLTAKELTAKELVRAVLPGDNLTKNCKYGKINNTMVYELSENHRNIDNDSDLLISVVIIENGKICYDLNKMFFSEGTFKNLENANDYIKQLKRIYGKK